MCWQAMVFPFSGNHFQKFYFGTNETLIPVYQVHTPHRWRSGAESCEWSDADEGVEDVGAAKGRA